MLDTLVAAGVCSADGLTTRTRGCSIARTGIGIYLVTLDKAYDPFEVIVETSITGSADRNATYDINDATSFYICAFDTAGAAVDNAFCFSVRKFAVDGVF